MPDQAICTAIIGSRSPIGTLPERIETQKHDVPTIAHVCGKILIFVGFMWTLCLPAKGAKS